MIFAVFAGAIKTVRETEMTIVIGTAVALGVAYACVAPWFYCKPDMSDEDSRTQNIPVPADEVSAANQTLTSTTVRVTGLRGLNFVSVAIPSRPSMSSGVPEHSQETSSEWGSSLGRSHVGGRSIRPRIAYFNVRESPEIQIVPASSDSSGLGDHSSEFLTAAGTSGTTQSRSVQSNNSNCTCSAQASEADSMSTEVKVPSRPKIKKPPRAHPPNPRSAVNTLSCNRPLSSSKTVNHAQTQTESFTDKETSAASRFVGRKNSRKLSRPLENHDERSSARQRDSSLYPEVAVIVRGNISSTTTSPVSSICQDQPVSSIDRLNCTSRCSTNDSRISETQYSTNKSTSYVTQHPELSSERSTNKRSKLSKFITKRCKRLWMTMNRSSSTKSKSSVTSANIPTGHSTLNQPINSSRMLQGQLDQSGRESVARQRYYEDSQHEKSSTKRDDSSFRRPKVLPFTRGIPSCIIQDLERIKNHSQVQSATSSVIPMTGISNDPPLMCRIELQDYDDEPLDLSCKSRLKDRNNEHQSTESDESTCTAFVRDLNQVVQGVGTFLKMTRRAENLLRHSLKDNSKPEDTNNNLTSETSRPTLKKSISLNFIKTKLNSGKKCHSLPERNKKRIPRRISELLYLHRRTSSETTRYSSSKESTNFPECDSVEQTPTDFNRALIFEEYVSTTIVDDDETQYLELEQMNSARHIISKEL